MSLDSDPRYVLEDLEEFLLWASAGGRYKCTGVHYSSSYSPHWTAMDSKSCIQFPSTSISSVSLVSPRSWLASLARQSILSALPRAISIGYLVIDDADGQHAFGFKQKDANFVYIKVVHENFWLRLMLCVFLFSLPYQLNSSYFFRRSGDLGCMCSLYYC